MASAGSNANHPRADVRDVPHLAESGENRVQNDVGRNQDHETARQMRAGTAGARPATAAPRKRGPASQAGSPTPGGDKALMNLGLGISVESEKDQKLWFASTAAARIAST
jgi:hypothetical protein